jgi:hypothetical protein
MVIGGYSIYGYWWLFLFMAIGGYFIYGYRWLFYLWLSMAIQFMAIVAIILIVIDGYSINGY